MSVDPRYPIGEHERAAAFTPDLVPVWTDRIRALPDELEEALAGLSDAQLDTPYREGGWTVRQLVHHIADSHLNAHARFRLTLTEDNPTIRTYREAEWAKLADSELPLAASLAIVRGVHARWTALLDSLALEDFARPLHHPEIGDITLGDLFDTYQWHGRHHVAHILALRAARDW